MKPRSSMTARRAWPPRAARWLATNLARGRRLPWLPLWLAWRRARTMHAEAGVRHAAPNPANGATSLTLSLSYRFDWSPLARAAAAVPNSGGAGPVSFVVQPDARSAFAAGSRRALMSKVTRLSAHFRGPDRAVARASNAAPPFTATVSRVQRNDASFVMPRVAARDELPSHGRLPRRRELLQDLSPVPRGRSGDTRGSAASIGATTSPYQPIRLHPAGPAAARTNDLMRSAPTRREVPSNAPSPRPRVALDWRVPATETAVGSSAARSRPGASAIDVSAAPAPHQAAVAATQAPVKALEPAVAERLVQDVIRRVDRRLRIERERRGL